MRLAGRVIAIDPAGRVLLFHYDDPPPKGKHWPRRAAGSRADEDFYAAARRELAGRPAGPTSRSAPAEVFEETYVHWLAHYQGLVRQTDHFFVGRVPEERRPLGEVAAMHESDGIRASPLVDGGRARGDRRDRLPEGVGRAGAVG